MKTRKFFFSFLFLIGTILYGFSQGIVKDINDLKFIPENLVPDVNGKVLLSEDFINHVLSEETKNDIPIFPGWPVIENGSSQRGGIYCNLDEDSDLEIVYCIGQQVYAWKIDGTIVTGWPQSLQLYPNGAPAFGDVDGDSEGEVVVSTATPGTGAQGRIFVFEKDGSTTPGFPIILGGGATKTPVLADLDGDDVLEIIVEERDYPDGYVGVYNGDGSSYPGFPVMMDYIPGSAVAVGDITGDNVPEIIAESYYSVYAYDISGNVLEGFPFTPGNNRVFSYSSPVLADLDGDGMREIIVGDHSLSAGNGVVHVIKNDGTPFPGWPKYTGSWIYGPPAVGDIDGDGSLDIAIGDQVLSPSPAAKVYVWDKDGNYLAGWPSELIWSINNQILLTDLDGDNFLELMWDDNTGVGKYLGYNHDGTAMEGWPLPVQWSTFFMNPFVADVNNDGITDISGGGIDIGGNNDCAVYLWDAGADYHPELNVLPVLQYNVQHDGVYVDASTLIADFIGSPLMLCEGSEVQFTDQSNGDVISWVWTFEGGDPASSTEQNPIVNYEVAGNYDVSLTISDGSNTQSITKTDYVKVATNPVIPDQPVGPTEVITSQTLYTVYETSSTNATGYSWQLTPEDMGLIIAGDTITQVKVYWDQSNSYVAHLNVKAENICGESEFSDPLTIYVNWNTDISSQGEDIFEIFPNPNNGILHIDFKYLSGNFEFTVMNSMGKILKRRSITVQKNCIIKIDISDLSDGIYFLRLEAKGKAETRKLLVMRR